MFTKADKKKKREREIKARESLKIDTRLRRVTLNLASETALTEPPEASRPPTNNNFRPYHTHRQIFHGGGVVAGTSLNATI